MRPLTGKRRQGSTREVPWCDDDRDQVAARRSAATALLGGASAAAARVAAAPPGYLLTQGSSDIARHCELLTPLPGHGETRAVVTPAGASGQWHLDVASRDRPGQLAAFAGVLAGSGIDVVQAVLATWDDGGALKAFVIRSASPPDVLALQRAFQASLGEPLSSPPVADAVVAFDSDATSLYTRCDVTAADRPGLLHAIAVAIATARGDVHAARVTTVDGVARDHFDISDRWGQKLGATLEGAIRAGVVDGVPARRRRLGPSVRRNDASRAS